MYFFLFQTSTKFAFIWIHGWTTACDHIGDIVHTGEAKGISHYLYLPESGAQPQSPQTEDLWLGPIFLRRLIKANFTYSSFKTTRPLFSAPGRHVLTVQGPDSNWPPGFGSVCHIVHSTLDVPDILINQVRGTQSTP